MTKPPPFSYKLSSHLSDQGLDIENLYGDTVGLRFEILSKYCNAEVLCFWCDEGWNSSWMSDMGSKFFGCNSSFDLIKLFAPFPIFLSLCIMIICVNYFDSIFL